MKHWLAGARLTLFILVGGCLAALALTLWAGSLGTANAGKPDSAPQVGVAVPPPHGNASNPSSSYVSATCNVAVTTTADAIGGQFGNDFSRAAPLAQYTDLSLVGDVNVPAGQVPALAFDEYFFVNNAPAGATYTITADPDFPNNYSLGIFVYDQSQNEVKRDDDTGDVSAMVTFIVTSTGTYYIKVAQITPVCFGRTYSLSYIRSTPAPGTVPDVYDNPPGSNDTINTAKLISRNDVTGLTLCNQTLCLDPVGNPSNDNDWYVIAATLVGYGYTVSAGPDDVYPTLNMQVYGPDKTTLIGQVIGSDSPSISWTLNAVNNYYVHIWRTSGSPTNGTYSLSWNTTGPTRTPTPTATGSPGPTDTPVPGLDPFEPNFDFDHAAGIGLNVKYTGINFVPLPGQSINNDYFKIRVKRGMLVTCETLDLSAGTDTNMILYDDNRNGLAGNDDVNTAAGDLRSRVTVSINYDGFLYVLVGQGFAVPNAQASSYNYSLQCTTPGNALSTPTYTPVPYTGPTFTPAPSPTPLPSATLPATPMPPISVRALPTPTPAGPAQQMVTADLRVYYDADENGVADPGEGVVGLPAYVYDATTGALLAQGFTDGAGHAVFTVPAAGPIRLVVPYLSFETFVPPSGAAIPVRISPRELPDRIP